MTLSLTLAAVTLKQENMYSSSDFEKVWFLYKTEDEPKGISINAFCENQGVPDEHLNKK
jgi:hypothetical protein